jgi:hypothetical protein
VVEQVIAPRTLRPRQPPLELKVVISMAEEIPADQVPGLEVGAIRCVLKALGNRFPMALYLSQAHGLTILTRELGTQEILQILAGGQAPPPDSVGEA